MISVFDLENLRRIESGEWMPAGYNSRVVAQLIDMGLVKLDEDNKPILMHGAIQIATKIRDDKLAKDKQREMTKKSKDKRIEAWAKDNLILDMFVQVTGARDGLGLRKIIELRGSYLIGRVYRNGRHLGAKRSPGGAIPDSYITEHQFKKLKAVWINDGWVNIAKLTKETK